MLTRKQVTQERAAGEAHFIYRHRLELAIAFLLAVGTFAVFGWSCAHDFINYDDGVYVTENPHVQSGLTPSNIRWAFTTFYASNWHPLTWLSLQLDSQIYGMRPWGFHLTNVLLHAANAILLFLALKTLTGRIWPSCLVAAFFAVHPLHVESVAWVTERKDVLSGLFWMLTLLAYARYVSHPRWSSYVLVAAALTLGLLAKPMLVALPFVLLLLDYWPLGRLATRPSLPTKERRSQRAAVNSASPGISRRFGIMLVEKLPLLALAVCSALVTWYAQSQRTVRSLHEYSLPIRCANASMAYCAYLGQTLWPANLGLFYPHPAGEITTRSQMSIPSWQPIAAFLFVAGVSMVAVNKRRSLPYGFVGWFWYLGTLVPVIGFVQVGAQARADRYTYIPLIGLFLAAVWGADQLSCGWRRQKTAAGISALILAILMLYSFGQVSYWHDSKTLWQHTLEACGESSVAHTNLAQALRARGDLQEAARHGREAVRLDPGYAAAHGQFAGILFDLGDLPEAARHGREAARLDPGIASTHDLLAVILFDLGKEPEALEHFQECIRLRPDWAQPRYNRARALALSGRTADAIVEYEEVLRLQPDFADAHYNLGLLHLDGGRPREAEDHFRQALTLGRRGAQTYSSLADAQAEQGKFEEAVANLQLAREAARANGQAELTGEIEKRLPLYQSGKSLPRGGAPKRPR